MNHQVEDTKDLPALKLENQKTEDNVWSAAASSAWDKNEIRIGIKDDTAEKKSEWKKGEPDTVYEKAKEPSEKDIESALKAADKVLKNPLSKEILSDLLKGNMEHLSWQLHDLRNNYPSGIEGQGKKELQAAIDELNKVLRYPMSLVEGEGKPPELGLKMHTYSYCSDPEAKKAGIQIGPDGRPTARYNGEDVYLTIKGYGKYETNKFVDYGTSGGNLGVGLAESEYRMKQMLASSFNRY